MKICSICKIEKEIKDFPVGHTFCRKCKHIKYKSQIVKELTGEDAIDMFGGDVKNILEELAEPIKERKYDETMWREPYANNGIGTCDSPQWLLNGCPAFINGNACGNKSWEVTSDCWAYCKKCSIGIHTDFPFTNSGELISDLNPLE